MRWSPGHNTWRILGKLARRFSWRRLVEEREAASKSRSIAGISKVFFTDNAALTKDSKLQPTEAESPAGRHAVNCYPVMTLL